MNISTSGFEFRWRFILDNVIYYTSEILQSNGSDRGYYTRPHQGMVSNSDNYWIARFLYEFSSIEPDQLKISRLVLEELKSKIPVSVLFLFVFFTLAGVAGIITLNQELGTEVIAGILLAISSAVVAKFVEYIIPRIQG
jgi:hypothetical protein